MGTGYLKVQCKTADDALPVANARVLIKNSGGKILYITETDLNGNTDIYPLPAPDIKYTLEPSNKRAYSVCDVDVSADGYKTIHIHDVEITDTETSILPVEMIPLENEPLPITEIDIYIPPVGLLIPETGSQVTSINPFLRNEVIIPEYITVHLGVPSDTSAKNVRVKFPEYVKNVTSSEIYSTWPYNSLVANINVIVTFALNRVFTEWYRSRGFNFDITNSTRYDQYFREGAQIYENISRIVDGIFNVYARRIGFINPFFTMFCNGTTATCNGLSQWGTVSLANLGYTPLEILHYYYPNDLELVQSNNITGITESYPGYPLRLGSSGEPVRRMQTFLNRIRVNYPLIPRIPNPNGYFGPETLNAVKVFQEAFNLVVDGIIGRATWNKISYIFVAVARLAELDSEGIRYTIGLYPPRVILYLGSRGEHVLQLQFILNTVALYYYSVPPVIMDGVFDYNVQVSVKEFQKTFGLTQDGVVGPATWNKLYSVYRGIANART